MHLAKCRKKLSQLKTSADYILFRACTEKKIDLMLKIWKVAGFWLQSNTRRWRTSSVPWLQLKNRFECETQSGFKFFRWGYVFGVMFENCTKLQGLRKTKSLSRWHWRRNYYFYCCWCLQKKLVDAVSEWLRRWTRIPLGSAREGSNPFGVAVWSLFEHGLVGGAIALVR